MLAADQRLRHSDDFQRTVRSGRRAGAAALVLHLLLDSGGDPAEPPRIGFIVGKAVGGSVVRNRVKRRLRHLVRESLTRVPLSSVLVVRALPAAATMSSGELGADLARCLERVVTAPQATRVRAATGSGTRAEP